MIGTRGLKEPRELKLMAKPSVFLRGCLVVCCLFVFFWMFLVWHEVGCYVSMQYACFGGFFGTAASFCPKKLPVFPGVSSILK